MLIGGVDAVLVRAPSLDEGLAFYRDALGHALLWRTADSARLAMGDGGVELVLATGQGPETDLLVESIEEAEDVRGFGRFRRERAVRDPRGSWSCGRRPVRQQASAARAFQR